MSASHSGDGSGASLTAAIEEIAARFPRQQTALLPMLHAVQERFGYVPADAVPALARILNLSRAEVHGVVSFYHDFRKSPAGRNLIRLCRAESCQAMGAVELADHVQRRLGIKFGETSKDGAFTLEPVYCLGNCACSPAIIVSGEIHGRVTPRRFDEIVERMGKP
ncbi:MAG TPA: formate dehydrogenase subunit gamma [Candidatus Acidoferrales bacterium]|nr:formate dehydrogenase subunit gamma [Candidatus Acidoferrales bacterium]